MSSEWASPVIYSRTAGERGVETEIEKMRVEGKGSLTAVFIHHPPF